MIIRITTICTSIFHAWNICRLIKHWFHFLFNLIFECIHKIMNLGWFLDNDIYCTFNGISLNEERYPFISNKLILELKLKALQVSNQIYDDKYKYEFLVAIGKEILDKNLKMGYGYLMNINKGIMHSMLFNKNSEINQDFNIQMLFEWYYLRAKISDEKEIIIKNKNKINKKCGLHKGNFTHQEQLSFVSCEILTPAGKYCHVIKDFII